MSNKLQQMCQDKSRIKNCDFKFAHQINDLWKEVKKMKSMCLYKKVKPLFVN